jgi:DNA mismatch endonuclease (patch repair protein)
MSEVAMFRAGACVKGMIAKKSKPSAARSANMAAIRSKDTKPEIAVRKALHRMGFRFRLHVRELPGQPDIVLPKYRTVIQVKGCFWHQHTCADGRLPKSNRDYWVAKLLRKWERDGGGSAGLMAASECTDFRHTAGSLHAIYRKTQTEPILVHRGSDRMNVPPDPESMNNNRADWARDILDHFEQYGERVSVDLSTQQQREVTLQNLSDLIADLGHFCDRNGLWMHEAIQIASKHYGEETHHEGEQFNPTRLS